MDRLDADVCVVGAGQSGMAAAWRLHQAGKKVIVLEARDRVGGRTWTVPLSDGTQVDRGAGWFGPGQDRSYALAEEMGIETYPSFGEGENLIVKDGKAARYKGTIPTKISLYQLANLGLAVQRLDAMAKKVPFDAPWAAPDARNWDNRTLGHWIESNVDSGRGRDMLRATMTDLFTSDLSEVSLLGALHLIGSNRGIEDLGAIKNGHQQDRVVGGTQSIPNAIHERLGDAVRLSAPVREISQRGDVVEVSSNGTTVTARRAIVSVPAWLNERIWWDPPLPHDRAQLIQRVPAGAIYKIHLVYDSPWWRDEGLTGQTLDTSARVPVTLDACGPDPSPGILATFCAGPDARELSRMTPDERRETVIGDLIPRFGPRAAQVSDYIEQDWTGEAWTRGGMLTHFPPGVLTSFGPALRAPVGGVHFAGTETAANYLGTVHGAIESGERAADEVLAAV